MQVNPQSVKKQFEKSLDKYSENAVVQKLMAQKLVDALENKNFDTILELGAGSGVLTSEIVSKIQFKKYIANDLVARSKKYLDRILKDYEFILGNAQKVKLNERADLVISNAMFQWFKNLESVLIHYKNLLKDEGIIAFSTFSVDNFKEIKDLTGLSLEYLAVDEIRQTLENTGFEIVYLEEFQQVLNFNSPLEILAHMKNTGVNSLSSKSWNFKDVKDFCDKYNQKYPGNSLTYSPVIVIAQKR